MTNSLHIVMSNVHIVHDNIIQVGNIEQAFSRVSSKATFRI